MRKKTPIITDRQIMKRLAATRQPFHDSYYAMYSSVLGGIVTNPVLMTVPVDDHMVHRGDGVFESFKCCGGKVYNLRGHLIRLMQSMGPLGMELACNEQELVRLICDTIEAGGRRDALIRLLVSRGPGSMSVNPYECPRPQIYIVVYKLPPPFMETHPQGARIETSAVPLKPSFFARVKTCNYLPNVLMRKEAVDRGVDFMAAFDTAGFLAEGATENIAIVSSDGCLASPFSSHILTGTTMLRVMELARPLVGSGLLEGIRQRNITRADMRAAREVLILGTTVNVTAVTEYDGKPVGDGRPGPVYEKLSGLLQEDMTLNSEMLTPVFEGRRPVF